MPVLIYVGVNEDDGTITKTFLTEIPYKQGHFNEDHCEKPFYYYLLYERHIKYLQIVI